MSHLAELIAVLVGCFIMPIEAIFGDYWPWVAIPLLTLVLSYLGFASLKRHDARVRRASNAAQSNDNTKGNYNDNAN